MATSYVFFCGVQSEGEFEKTGFLHATKNSLRFFPTKRASFGIMELSFMGMIFPYIIGVLSLAPLAPRWFNPYWIFLPGLLLWGTKSWQWAERIALRYTERRWPISEELRVRQVKMGMVRQTLHVDSGERKSTLSIQCRRRTLAKALELASHPTVAS